MTTVETDISLKTEIQTTPKLPYEDTIEFLKKARCMGVYEDVLDSSEGEMRGDRKQTLLIADEYFHSPFSAKDLGKKYFGTESYIYSRRGIAVRLLHAYSPEELRIQYPIERMTLGKPRTEWANLKSSQSRGTNVGKIIQSVKAGATAQGVMLEFGLSVEATSDRRALLRKLNINVPYQIIGLEIAREITEALNDSHLTDERAQELLNKVRTSYFRHNIGPSGSLMTLKELVSEAGLRYINNQTKHYDALTGKVPKGMIESKNDKKKGISHKRRFIFRHDKERAIQVLQGDPSLHYLKIK